MVLETEVATGMVGMVVGVVAVVMVVSGSENIVVV